MYDYKTGKAIHDQHELGMSYESIARYHNKTASWAQKLENTYLNYIEFLKDPIFKALDDARKIKYGSTIFGCKCVYDAYNNFFIFAGLNADINAFINLKLIDIYTSDKTRVGAKQIALIALAQEIAKDNQ